MLFFSQNDESILKPTLLISCFMIGCAGATGPMKDSDKLKLMLLAWNYHNNQGKHTLTHTFTDIFTILFVKYPNLVRTSGMELCRSS